MAGHVGGGMMVVGSLMNGKGGTTHVSRFDLAVSY